eukprot:752819-Hanusia_phi.AAC.4
MMIGRSDLVTAARTGLVTSAHQASDSDSAVRVVPTEYRTAVRPVRAELGAAAAAARLTRRRRPGAARVRAGWHHWV